MITPSANDDGIANPIPTLPPDGEYIAVLTPITSPSKLNNGPPEFPLFIGASVCIKSSKGPAFISLAFAETIPNVTVVAKPKGFPIANAQFPTFALSELPQLYWFKIQDQSQLLKLLNLFFYQNLSILLVVMYHHAKLL